jgi:hypothetical protein
MVTQIAETISFKTVHHYFIIHHHRKELEAMLLPNWLLKLGFRLEFSNSFMELGKRVKL